MHWQICEYERDQEGNILKYKMHVGLAQANITMAKMLPTSTEYIEYHNLRIGFTESKYSGYDNNIVDDCG